MIGTKFSKPIQDDFIYVDERQEENTAPNTLKKYAEAAAWCNQNDAHIEDKGDYYEVVENIPYEPTEEEKKAARVAELKAKLAETDYIAAKIAEGAATKEEYADVIAQREIWRVEIRTLEEA